MTKEDRYSKGCGGVNECEECDNPKNRAPLLAMEAQQEKAVVEMKESLESIPGLAIVSGFRDKIAEKLIELGWRKQ